MFANVAKLSPSSYSSFSLGWLSINFSVHTHPPNHHPPVLWWWCCAGNLAFLSGKLSNRKPEIILRIMIISPQLKISGNMLKNLCILSLLCLAKKGCFLTEMRCWIYQRSFKWFWTIYHTNHFGDLWWKQADVDDDPEEYCYDGSDVDDKSTSKGEAPCSCNQRILSVRCSRGFT